MLVDKLKSEPQKLYRYVRSRLKVKAMAGPLEKAPGQLTECDKEAAEVLNSFFESVFVEEDSTIIPLLTPSASDTETLTDMHITTQEVLNELRKPKVGKLLDLMGYPQ